MITRRLFVFVLAMILAGPTAVGRPLRAAADTDPITMLLQTTINDLGAPPLAVTVSRVVFTPGASDSETLSGLRLVIVESGHLVLSSDRSIDVTHNGNGSGTPPPGPTPTLTGSSTPDLFLNPGDTYPVPIQLMTVIRNASTTPAVIVDVRITPRELSLPPADLDSETLAAVSGVTTLPAGPVTVAIGRVTIPTGETIAGATAGAYQLVVPATGGISSIESQPDGTATNTGSSPLDVYVLSASPAVAAVPTPPNQPATGPGGAEVAFDQVVVAHKGDQPGDYTLFEPAAPHDGTASPTAATPLPIVLFFSAACCDASAIGGNFSSPYQDWIDHIVRRGAVVVEPAFRVTNDVEDSVTAIRAALADLQNGQHPPTDPNRILAFGHSSGSALAVNVAAVAAAEGLPVPAGLLLTSPGCGGCPIGDLGAIPATTRLVVVIAAHDNFNGDGDALRIWAGLNQIPVDRKDYVRLESDDHGRPALVADHPMPATAEWDPLDALDWYGTWKLFDALADCVVAGQDCDVNFGDTPAERFMGVWSDGVPVIEAEVTDDPGPPPATPTPAG